MAINIAALFGFDEGFLKRIESTQTLVFSAWVLLLSLALQLWRSSKKTSHQKALAIPPGRFGLPFIGETLVFLGSQKRNLAWTFFDDRKARHGEIFRTGLVGEPTVIASSAEGNKMVFTNENNFVNVAWPGSVITVLGKDSLIGQRGEQAKRTRQAMMNFLGSQGLQKHVRNADKNFQSFLKEHWAGKKEVRVFPLINKFTFSLACELLMGRHEKEDHEMLEKPFNIMMKGFLQLPIRLPGTRYSKAIAAANMLRSTLKVWMEERRRDMAAAGNKASDAERDVLSSMLSYRDDDGKRFSDQHIVDNILLLLSAGHDTVTVVISMACRFLALNPAILEEVYRENKVIAAEKDPDEPLTWADITQKMSLSWRVLQETMRLQPPVQGSFRVVIKEFAWNGFRIPKAWKMYWSPHSTHRNPKYFPDPSKFDPSRFEGEGPAPYTFVPFGGGSRMCPGKWFARMEASVILHHIVTRFSWTLVDPDEMITVDPLAYPMKGLPIHLEARPT